MPWNITRYRDPLKVPTFRRGILFLISFLLEKFEESIGIYLKSGWQ
jgi:hypothetical protein